MKIIYITIVLLFILQSLAYSINKQKETTVADLFAKKPFSFKSDIFGRKIKSGLQQTGTGISRQQENFILQQMGFALQSCGENLLCNAKFIGQKIEDVLGGRWNV